MEEEWSVEEDVEDEAAEETAETEETDDRQTQNGQGVPDARNTAPTSGPAPAAARPGIGSVVAITMSPSVRCANARYGTQRRRRESVGRQLGGRPLAPLAAAANGTRLQCHGRRLAVNPIFLQTKQTLVLSRGVCTDASIRRGSSLPFHLRSPFQDLFHEVPRPRRVKCQPSAARQHCLLGRNDAGHTTLWPVLCSLVPG
jgi:hypothetical protein